MTAVPVFLITSFDALDCRNSGNRSFSSNIKDLYPTRSDRVPLRTGKRSFETMDSDVLLKFRLPQIFYPILSCVLEAPS